MCATIPQLVYQKSFSTPNAYIQYRKNKAGTFEGITYVDFIRSMLNFAGGLLSIGTQSGENIGLISDNRQEWLVASLGIMALRCPDIPRGSEATSKDLEYILSFAECKTVVTENAYSLKKILENASSFPKLKNLIVLDNNLNGIEVEKYAFSFYIYNQILEKGIEYRNENPGKVEEILKSGQDSDSATIIFTSGTTGVPKGVELTHKNFTCQFESIHNDLRLKPGEKALCVLPVWHVYEREMEYYELWLGVSLCYSKPVVSMIVSDCNKIGINFMACVPRIWDGLYSQIEKQCCKKSRGKKALFHLCVASTSSIKKLNDIMLGRTFRLKKTPWILTWLNKLLWVPKIFLMPIRSLGNMLFFNSARNFLGSSFKLGLTGGGGIPPKLDKFFNSIGIKLLEGYGLTETAPIVAIRNRKRPVLQTIGKTATHCETRVVDKYGRECKPGQMGVLYVRGDNVMKGYYKQPELTSEVLVEGWFNTGDLCLRSYNGELMIKGRAKDTIVLRSGENVEPFPIECKINESPFILQSMVVGQDKNCLGALILPCKEEIEKFASCNNIFGDYPLILKNPKIHELIFKELERQVCAKNGFKAFEKIGKFAFIEKPFEVGVELSAKGTIMRYKVLEMYKWQITSMYSEGGLVHNLQNLAEKIVNNSNKR